MKTGNRFTFLLDSPKALPLGQHHCQQTLEHSTPLARGPSDVYFFPPRHPWSDTPLVSSPRSVFLFLPGNPGLLSFYVPFLTTLAQSPLFPPNCAILAIGHVSHAPHLDQPEGGPVGLEGLVQTQLAVVDELREILGQGGKLNVGGHSMGCWVAVEMLKARPEVVTSLTLLFPTISHIVKSPNGRMLWPIFTPLAYSLLPAFSYLLRPLLYLNLVPPATASLVRSPPAIRAALHLGRDEMATIRGADWDFLRRERGRIWGYWGVGDGWVDEEQAKIGRDVLGGEEDAEGEAKTGVQRIWRCVESIPHAFCLEHGEIMAHKILPWLAQTLGNPHSPSSSLPN